VFAKEKYIFTFSEQSMFCDFGKSMRPVVDKAAYACNCVGETVGHLAQLTITIQTTNYKLTITKVEFIVLFYIQISINNFADLKLAQAIMKTRSQTQTKGSI